MKRIRPFLKWAGNKFRCLDIILASLPPGNRLIEPFTGSGAVFLNTNYEQYLLAEENRDLINLYKYIQKDGDKFIKHCAELFTSTNNQADCYYELREEFNGINISRRRAILFLYLNRHGYNGLCRYNRSGGYNVPFGRYHKPYFPKQELFYFKDKIKYAHLVQSDFRKTFELAKAGDVIYCDPPYVPLPTQTSAFTSYVNKKFELSDQLELADLAEFSAKNGIITIISNHDTEFTRKHYNKAELIPLQVQRSINCIGSGRQRANELIAIFHPS